MVTCEVNRTSYSARPYTLIIRATERCEVGCDHCSISATPRGQDMDLDLLEAVLPAAQAAGVGLIHFSGGEPLLQANLEEFVHAAAERGLFVEVTTSTWSRPGEEPSARISELKRQGLQRLMLSYDASHARRVNIAHYADFLRVALEHDIEVCACVVEWPGTDWPLERVKMECAHRGALVDAVDWCRIGLSLAGRAATRYAHTRQEEASGTRPSEARCPYVFTAPTLTPDGTVFLCPNVQSRSPLFRLGNVRDTPLDTILERTQSSRFFRALAYHGPGKLSSALGDLARPSYASDMCACCQAVVRAAEDEGVFAKVESFAPPDGMAVPLEVESLLPGHQRFVRGEDRPAMGCTCE